MERIAMMHDLSGPSEAKVVSLESRRPAPLPLAARARAIASTREADPVAAIRAKIWRRAKPLPFLFPEESSR